MPVMVSQLGDLHNLVHFCAHFLHCLGPFSFHCWVKEQQILKKTKKTGQLQVVFFMTSQMTLEQKPLEKKTDLFKSETRGKKVIEQQEAAARREFFPLDSGC